MKLPKGLLKEMQQGRMNNWFHFNGISIYVRKSTRLINGEMRSALDLANIHVVKSSNRSKGLFTSALCLFEMECDRLGFVLFVENVLSQRFYRFFIKRGYRRRGHITTFPPCVYRRPNANAISRPEQP